MSQMNGSTCKGESREKRRRVRINYYSWQCLRKNVYVSFCQLPNNISLSESFCSLRSGFHRAIYDASTFFLLLVFFGAFETIVHVRQWPILFRRCFNSSKLLVELLWSFHLTSALRLVSTMYLKPQEHSFYSWRTIYNHFFLSKGIMIVYV